MFIGNLFLLFFGLFCSQDLLLPGFPDYDNLVTRIRSQYGKHLEKQFNYQIIGTGGGIEKEVYFTSWYIMSFRQVDLAQARREYIKITEGLLLRLNHHHQLKLKLKGNQLTQRNVDFMLSYKNKDLSFNKGITLVIKKLDMIYYDIQDPNNPNGYKDFHEETYEEALAIVRAEEQSGLIMHGFD